MAIAEDGGFGARLAPFGDQHRAAAHRVIDDLAVKAEAVQGGCDLVGEIGAQYRKALLDLAFGRDRDAAGEVGGETALVEIRFGGGDRSGAGHAGLLEAARQSYRRQPTMDSKKARPDGHSR